MSVQLMTALLGAALERETPPAAPRSPAVPDEVPSTTSLVVWRGLGPAAAGGWPVEWVHCVVCGASEWFPRSEHGQVLQRQAMDRHLGCRRGGGPRG